jgi:hypothetical protein
MSLEDDILRIAVEGGPILVRDAALLTIYDWAVFDATTKVLNRRGLIRFTGDEFTGTYLTATNAGRRLYSIEQVRAAKELR